MSEPPYEVLEHTADIGLRIRGESLPELFRNAALGLVELTNTAAEKPMDAARLEEISLSVQGADLEDLLVNWLSELLYRIDGEGWNFAGFEVESVDASALRGKAKGTRRDIASPSRVIPVKAVTYHQVSVKQEDGRWEATIYFDI